MSLESAFLSRQAKATQIDRSGFIITGGVLQRCNHWMCHAAIEEEYRLGYAVEMGANRMPP